MIKNTLQQQTCYNKSRHAMYIYKLYITIPHIVFFNITGFYIADRPIVSDQLGTIDPR